MPTWLLSRLLSAQNIELMISSGSWVWILRWSWILNVVLYFVLHSFSLLIDTSICVSSFPASPSSPLWSLPQPWTVIPKPTLDAGEVNTVVGRQMELMSALNESGWNKKKLKEMYYNFLKPSMSSIFTYSLFTSFGKLRKISTWVNITKARS